MLFGPGVGQQMVTSAGLAASCVNTSVRYTHGFNACCFADAHRLISTAALGSPPSPPINNQFLRLCGDPHNRNYDEMPKVCPRRRSAACTLAIVFGHFRIWRVRMAIRHGQHFCAPRHRTSVERTTTTTSGCGCGGRIIEWTHFGLAGATTTSSSTGRQYRRQFDDWDIAFRHDLQHSGPLFRGKVGRVVVA
jgi:hypothetical protein